jgi:RNA recognition motif-containing protein
MQRDLDLHAPIEAPRPGALLSGTHPQARRQAGHVPDRGRQAATTDRPRPTATETRSVYVANLPWATTTDDLRALFAPHGEVHTTTIITDRRTGRSKGFGFVDMPRSAAEQAIASLHQSTVGGRDLTVRLARPRSSRT